MSPADDPVQDGLDVIVSVMGECDAGGTVLLGGSAKKIIPKRPCGFLDTATRATRLGANIYASYEFMGLTDCGCNAGVDPGIVIAGFGSEQHFPALVQLETDGLVATRGGYQLQADRQVKFTKQADGRIAIDLPPLDHYEIVVFEY